MNVTDTELLDALNEELDALNIGLAVACREMDKLRDDKRTLLIALKHALPILQCGFDEELEIAEAALACVERK
jgi:cell division FtsZ-interacting protein ZapD